VGRTKKPSKFFDGQEVQNNLWNCVLIQYIRNPPDPVGSGVIFTGTQKKTHFASLIIYSDAKAEVLTPHQCKITSTRVLYDINMPFANS